MKTSLALTLAGTIGLAAAAQAQVAPLTKPSPGKVYNMPHRQMSEMATMSGVRAFGLINPDGSIVYRHGIVSATNVEAGVYCVTLSKKMLAATASPVLSFNYNSTHDFRVFVVFSPSAEQNCAKNSVAVVTYNTDSGSVVLTNEGFTIAVP